MTLYSVFLFVHFLGVVGLLSAGVTMFRIGKRLRTAQTVEETRLWLGLARGTAPFFPVSAVMLLVTGLHMAGSAFSFTLPWVMVALVTVVALLPAGPLVQRPKFMAMGKAAMGASPGPVGPELKEALTDPVVWTLAYLSNGAALGLLWIMTQKPAGWIGAAVPVVVLGAVGAFLGARVAVRDRQAADAAPDQEAPPRTGTHRA